MKNYNPKRNHHYVWQYYLKAWADDKGQLQCLYKKSKKIFPTITKNAAFKKDIYKLNKLTIEDLLYIRRYALSHNAELNKLLINWYEIYVFLFKLQKAHENMIERKAHKKVTIEENQKLLRFETIENYHCIVEQFGIKYLDQIRLDRNLECVQSGVAKTEFLSFIATQFLRTKRALQAIYNVRKKDNFPSKMIDLIDFSIMEKHWYLFTPIFATSLAWQLLDYKIVLLENNTEISFITSDQPIIITKPQNRKLSDFNLYYPISANISIMVTNEDDNTNKRSLDKLSVESYNWIMANLALDNIYSNSEIQLTNLSLTL